MDAVLNWLWQGGVVAIVAAGALHLLDRARAAIRCLVCWAALIVVVLLPLVSSALTAAPPTAPAVPTIEPIVTVPVAWWTSTALIAIAWGIWTGSYAIRLAVAIVVVRRAKSRCRPFPLAVDSTLAHWRRVREAGRSARLVLSDRISAAAVLGCGTPVIAVAPALVGRLDADELDRVVIHEWAHVQRRDDLANIGQLLVRAVAGWHPAVWWLDRRLSIEQELACDETVVAVTGGAKSYASCLVKLASLRAAQPDVLLASGALSSGGLTRRVARLLLLKECTSAAWGRGAAALVVVLLVALALGVASLRIVEAAVSATVARVLHPVAGATPIALRAAVTPQSSSPPPAPATVAPRPTDRLGPADVRAPEVAQPAPERETEAVEESRPSAAAGASDVAAAVAPAEPALVTVPSPVHAASPSATDADPGSPWSPVTDAGTAIGRGSKKAGVATAGAFTRFAKRIAGSF